MHKALGGSGLKVLGATSFLEVEVPESEYELFENTPFSNMRTEQVEDPRGVDNYSRLEVYKALSGVVRLRHIPKVIYDLSRRYPRKIWGGYFPLEGSLNTIVIRNESRLKRLISDQDVQEYRGRMDVDS